MRIAATHLYVKAITTTAVLTTLAVLLGGMKFP